MRNQLGQGSGNVYSNEDILRALDDNNGAVYVAATQLGCSYKTILRRAKKVQYIAEAIEKHRFKRTDKAEDQLGRAIDRGESWAILFQLRTQGKSRGYFGERDGAIPGDIEETEDLVENPLPFLPADVIAPSFLNVYRDVVNRRHTEYIFTGGRGSTKSSFVSLMMVYLLVNNPTLHGLAVRQVADTLRDSVYSQILWAIDELGLTEQFKCTTSPIEVTYIPTGQKIYFRGANDPAKIKSIKPVFGYIGMLWFEELDQFYGPEAIRKIEQSAIRGGDEAFIMKSFNPPRSIGNWANKYIKIPKKTQLLHISNYRDVPAEWLGKAFLEEAEHLQVVNPSAYEHEYMGVANGIGGMVFENVEIREITDKEIEGFERVLHGLDWGYYPDPAHYVRCYYDAARLTLYIFGEVRRWKSSNKEMYDALVEYGLNPSHTLICDSAEPKSIADFRDYGAAARGAEKGPDSLVYSMKWLQSLRSIVIDNGRAPYAAEEFLSYEYEATKEGEIISAFPDANNHAIDAVRYSTNHIWKIRGR